MSTTNYTTSVGLEMRTAADGNPIFVRFCTATLLAVAFHHLVFRKGEWHLKAPSLFGAWLMSFPLLFIGELVLSGQNLVSSAYLAFLTVGCFSIAMSGSIIIYRLFFHRLGGFPGPTMARVTKLWHSFQCLEGKNHLVLKKLYQQYGDFVRTGEV